jgi:hypothetical protein
MGNRQRWARTAALTAGLAIVGAAMAPDAILAQEAPVVLEQARSGEDGTSGAGAGSGNMSSGNAGRDRNGNAGTATAGTAGEAGNAENPEASSESLPENAELIDALGVLDDVTAAGIDVLTGLQIPVELLPAPVEEPVTAVPTDINTGGQGGSGENSSISTEPGTGSAPASGATSSSIESGTDGAPATGATSSAAEDGEGNSGTRDRPRRNADGGTDTAG